MSSRVSETEGPPTRVRPRAITPAAGGAVRRPRRLGSRAPAGTVALLLATAAADGDTPAAALPWEDGTVVGHLAEQLASLDIAAAHIVTRPAWRPALERAVEGAPLEVTVHASETTPDDLREIARLARTTGAGGLVVLPADIVTHREALAGLLADPRLNTAALVSNGSAGRPFTFRAKSVKGRIVSAGSPYHDSHRTNTAFLGVLRIGPGDVLPAAEIAERMAELATPPLPESWTPTLRARVGRWRVSLARAAAVARGEDPSEIPGSDPLDPATAATHPLAPEDEIEIRRRLAGAEVDVAALLLVGLVRGGLHVGNSYLRALFWARPLSHDAIAQAQDDIGRYDEDRVLLDSAVKANDGFFTTHFVSPYSKHIARWAAHRGLTPNQITTFSLGLGILAAALFATGGRPGLVAGGIVAHLSFVFDCVDGQLARYTRTFSRLGAWLDSVFDRAKEYVMFAGLAIGADRMGDDVWLLAAAALALQSMRHTLEFSFGVTRHRLAAEVPQPPPEQSLDDALTRVRASAPRLREEHEEDAISPAPVTPLRRVLRLWSSLNRVRGVLWVKKMIAFPIGERFAVIAIASALFTPRVTFTVLLAWGGFAAAYTISGRVLRSLRR